MGGRGGGLLLDLRLPHKLGGTHHWKIWRSRPFVSKVHASTPPSQTKKVAFPLVLPFKPPSQTEVCLFSPSKSPPPIRPADGEAFRRLPRVCLFFPLKTPTHPLLSRDATIRHPAPPAAAAPPTRSGNPPPWPSAPQSSPRFGEASCRKGPLVLGFSVQSSSPHLNEKMKNERNEEPPLKGDTPPC